ncbi:VOC family protein [Vibrio genomosp. F10]|uniref:VOC family protein n=1 Tax=Vibrio genomosp. F10 TaxID=723171 RepID=UPI00031BE073|nr:VOC family protein [Vibrio genomosp. F10]OEE93169.1 glyoxalase [Vibrio genomosp. F10 str. 9ZD137]
MQQHEKLNYIELPAHDLNATKSFFSSTFRWEFVDFGPDYIAFNNQGLDGGFFRSDACNETKKGGALIVFYSENIQETLHKVTENGGKIIQDIFEFPGGCRFHFTEPSGNEFAVWSESQGTEGLVS